MMVYKQDKYYLILRHFNNRETSSYYGVTLPSELNSIKQHSKILNEPHYHELISSALEQLTNKKLYYIQLTTNKNIAYSGENLFYKDNIELNNILPKIEETKELLKDIKNIYSINLKMLERDILTSINNNTYTTFNNDYGAFRPSDISMQCIEQLGCNTDKCTILETKKIKKLPSLKHIQKPINNEFIIIKKESYTLPQGGAENIFFYTGHNVFNSAIQLYNRMAAFDFSKSIISDDSKQSDCIIKDDTKYLLYIESIKQHANHMRGFANGKLKFTRNLGKLFDSTDEAIAYFYSHFTSPAFPNPESRFNYTVFKVPLSPQYATAATGELEKIRLEKNIINGTKTKNPNKI